MKRRLKIGERISYLDEESRNHYAFVGRIGQFIYSKRLQKYLVRISIYHQDTEFGPDELLLVEDDPLIKVIEHMDMKFIESTPNRLVETKDMDKQEWLRWRRSGITGTDVAAIFGMSPYKTAYQVYRDKLGLLPDLEDNNTLRLGRDMEGIVAKWFSEETGFKLENRYAIYQHAHFDWMLANIDRWIVGENAIFEAKIATYNNQAHQWGASGTDLVPPYYLFQVYMYMIVFGIRNAYLAVIFTDTRDFRWYHFELDETLANQIIEETYNFWFGHVMPETEPVIMTFDDVLLKYPEENRGAMVANDRVRELCIEHEAGRQLIKELRQRQDEIKVSIGRAMGGYRDLLVDKQGKALAAFATPNPREQVNIELLKEKYPEAANETIYASDPKRSLSLRWQNLKQMVE